MKISRRRLLIGMNSVFAMMSMPKIALANAPKINLEAAPCQKKIITITLLLTMVFMQLILIKILN